ncbi:hypothetical protein Tco_1195088 [Tanacetum coccineum]
MMDDLNITMEEYIRLEEEKARKHGKVFNCETAKYGKIWYVEDVHDLRSIETEFPAIVSNDNLTSNETLSCEPTVSSLNNNKIDSRISFDESDDEDYTPSVSYIDDLDFIKDFENEFSAIVYNDALTSKSDFSTEPTLSPQHIDEFDLKDETSLSEYDKIEQNVLYFNDLFPFNIIYPDDLKSDKDNDNNEIDMIQSSGGCSYKEFLACKPKEYNGKGGVVVLTRWIEKIEVGHAAYTDRFHELVRLVPHLVTPESRMIERYVYGLAPQIRGIVTATKPKTIQKAVQIFGALTDEAVMNGSIKKVEKRGNIGEPS